MKILVTGAAGFIGSHVVDAYLAAGHDVVAVDNLATGQRENVNPAARFYEADVRDLELMTRIFEDEKPDVVNHHAAQVNIRVSVERPLYDTEVNVVGTVSVLEAAARCQARKVIFISSGGAVYGEPRDLPATEETPPKPISHYGAAKLAGEAYCHVYHVTRGLIYTILRYANVYGPRQNPGGEAGVTAIFARMMLRGEQPRIFGDGTKTRDYVYVGDVAAANVAALDRGDGQVFNIGTGRQVSDREVFDAVARAAGYRGEPEYTDFRPGGVMHPGGDCAGAREVSGGGPGAVREGG
ncbi:MAG: NAD-dependent epimerase/dehydratase family protein, partial [Armatimonadetes bacterium]|nr:NAD-dependent epimerase/dehydratase family protein [Armatimonadota bacterium]